MQAIIDRMKEVIGASTDVELANHFGGSRSGPGVWKVRGSIPVTECIDLAEKYSVSLDWLILGRGTKQGGEAEMKAGAALQNVDTVALEVFDMATIGKDQAADQLWHVPRSWLNQEGLSADETVIVQADGDAGNAIKEGQVVFLDRRQCDVDGVYLVSFGGVMRFKRLQRMVAGGFRVSTDDGNYTSELVEPGAFEIIGHCYAVVARVS